MLHYIHCITVIVVIEQCWIIVTILQLLLSIVTTSVLQ